MTTPNVPADQQALDRVKQIVADYQAHLPQGHDLETDSLHDAKGLLRQGDS